MKAVHSKCGLTLEANTREELGALIEVHKTACEQVIQPTEQSQDIGDTTHSTMHVAEILKKLYIEQNVIYTKYNKSGAYTPLGWNEIIGKMKIVMELTDEQCKKILDFFEGIGTQPCDGCMELISHKQLSAYCFKCGRKVVETDIKTKKE